MARENVMSTPIFDQLLREMAQRAEPHATSPAPGSPATSSSSGSVASSVAVGAPATAGTAVEAPPAQAEELTPAPRRRHRAE